jgi:hypothetical protein
VQAPERPPAPSPASSSRGQTKRGAGARPDRNHACVAEDSFAQRAVCVDGLGSGEPGVSVSAVVVDLTGDDPEVKVKQEDKSTTG